MIIEKLLIESIKSPNKRLKATIYIKDKKNPIIRKFGSSNGYTYYDGASDLTKENYIKRHYINENWNDITTNGALSLWVLWYKRDINLIEKNLKERFNINNVNININKNNKK